VDRRQHAAVEAMPPIAVGVGFAEIFEGSVKVGKWATDRQWTSRTLLEFYGAMMSWIRQKSIQTGTGVEAFFNYDPVILSKIDRTQMNMANRQFAGLAAVTDKAMVRSVTYKEVCESGLCVRQYFKKPLPDDPSFKICPNCDSRRPAHLKPSPATEAAPTGELGGIDMAIRPARAGHVPVGLGQSIIDSREACNRSVCPRP
jgi:hypothetical protein